MSDRWSKHEETFLKANYPTMGADYCAKSLARAVSGIHRKAHKLGIKTIHSGGFNPEKPGELYFVSFKVGDETYYKVGITNQTAAQRLRADWSRLSFNVEWTITDTDGYKIRQMERELLVKYSDKLINTQALQNGNTETLAVYIEKPKELQ